MRCPLDDSSPNEIPIDPPWLAFAKLCRLPNLFTAWSDILAGFFIVSAFSGGGNVSLNVPGILICLMLASGLIYSAGMVLNDYIDREIDAQQRPDRPIPSGAISPAAAAMAGYAMLVVGCLFAFLGGYIYVGYAAIAWRGGAVAVILSLCVIAYDVAFKRTIVAPWLMGGCRFFNILLGMSLAKDLPLDGTWQLFSFDLGQWMFAGGIGLYIVGVTWFARTEAVQSNRMVLAFGAALMLLGVLLVGAIPWAQPSIVHVELSQAFGLGGILLLLSLALARRVVLAIHAPTPEHVQLAIQQAIFSLIFYDAAITLSVCGTVWSVVIVALLVPMLGLRRVMYST